MEYKLVDGDEGVQVIDDTCVEQDADTKDSDARGFCCPRWVLIVGIILAVMVIIVVVALIIFFPVMSSVVSTHDAQSIEEAKGPHVCTHSVSLSSLDSIDVIIYHVLRGVDRVHHGG